MKINYFKVNSIFMKKKICLIYTCRNDNYSNNFSERFQISLDINVKNIFKLSLQNKIEISIVDWGSAEKNLLLSKIYLNKKSSQIIKYIHIKKELSDKLSMGWPNKFNEAKAINLAISLTSAKYCMYTQHDSFFSSSSLYNLISLLDNKYKNNIENFFLFVPRKKLDLSFCIKKPSIDTYNYFIEKADHTFFANNSALYNAMAGMGGILMTKKNWVKSEGFLEQYTKDLDTEFNLRASRLFKKIHTGEQGIILYTQARENINEREKKLLLHPRIPPDVAQAELKTKNHIIKSDNFHLVKIIKKSESIEVKKNKVDFKVNSNFVIGKNIYYQCAYNFSKALSPWGGFLKLIFNDLSNLRIYKLLKKFRIFSLLELGLVDPDKLIKLLKNDNKYLFLFILETRLGDEKFKLSNSYFKLFRKLAGHHLGYSRAIFSKKYKEFNNLFADMPKEKFSTLVNFNSKYMKKSQIISYINILKNNSHLVGIIIFKCETINFLPTNYLKNDFNFILKKNNTFLFANKNLETFEYRNIKKEFEDNLVNAIYFIYLRIYFSIKFFVKNIFIKS